MHPGFKVLFQGAGFGFATLYGLVAIAVPREITAVGGGAILIGFIFLWFGLCNAEKLTRRKEIQ